MDINNQSLLIYRKFFIYLLANLIEITNLFVDDAECELNCKPVGMRYFATLKEKVIDGTICTRPLLYFKRNVESAVCVDGICKVSFPQIFILILFINYINKERF